LSEKFDNYSIEEKEILITGSSGFIGKKLIRSLALRNNVIGVQLEQPEQHMKNIGVNYIVKDIASLKEKDLPGNIDIVIHLAAILDNPLLETEQTSRMPLFEVNIKGTYLLLEIAKKLEIKKFIYGSSGGVYGFGEEIFKESDPIDKIPLNFYNLTKLLSEKMCRWYSQFMDTIILRYGAPYGPGTSNPMFKYLIDYSLVNFDINSSFKYKNYLFNPIYIDDAVNITERATILEGFHIINVGGPDIVSPLEITRNIMNKLRGKKVQELNKNRNEIGRKRILDIKKIEEILSYKFKFDIEKGISETIKSFANKNLLF